MYKMNSRNRGITAANAILRISCFIFRTVIAILYNTTEYLTKTEKKLTFYFAYKL